jgi:hypothetical protein
MIKEIDELLKNDGTINNKDRKIDDSNLNLDFIDDIDVENEKL